MGARVVKAKPNFMKSVSALIKGAVAEWRLRWWRLTSPDADFIETDLTEEPSTRFGRHSNRRESKGKGCGIVLETRDRELLMSSPFLRDIRKACVKEREEWTAIKKTLEGPYAKWAKRHERLWQQREKAATLAVNFSECPKLKASETDTYHWPEELAPAVEYVLFEALARETAQ